jgi:hypothetical protein
MNHANAATLANPLPRIAHLSQANRARNYVTRQRIARDPSDERITLIRRPNLLCITNENVSSGDRVNAFVVRQCRNLQCRSERLRFRRMRWHSGVANHAIKQPSATEQGGTGSVPPYDLRHKHQPRLQSQSGGEGQQHIDAEVFPCSLEQG